MFFGRNDFVVAVAVVVVVVVCFKCVDFIVFDPGIDVAAVHTLSSDCALAVVETVVVAIAID